MAERMVRVTRTITFSYQNPASSYQDDSEPFNVFSDDEIRDWEKKLPLDDVICILDGNDDIIVDSVVTVEFQ